MSLEEARAVADAVLYEGYLLYPYRATSRKNQSRWQFGVLGPPGAAGAGLGEDSQMAAECLLHATGDGPDATVTVHLRFLQLQARMVEQLEPGTALAEARFQPVRELTVDEQLMFSWDEAVEHEVVLPTYILWELAAGVTFPIDIEGGVESELLTTAEGRTAGRVIRERWPLNGIVRAETTQLGDYLKLTVAVDNTASMQARTKDEATRMSFIGAHLVIEARGRDFVSLLEPPDDGAEAVASCVQRRCWPVLAGPPGSTDVVLASPIILYDYPEVAPESPGALFDSTEIDEILTLRVLTMTDGEKEEARATDPRAREIIDRCERMTPDELQHLHGILRDPYVSETAPLLESAEFEDAHFDTGDVPWWDPGVDEQVKPELDTVLINGVAISRGSLVRVHPSRRADAQDLFFADQVARVTAVISDVDGQVHVALVLVDDPAADLHDWYGRYLYFAPDELEPLVDSVVNPQKESHS